MDEILNGGFIYEPPHEKDFGICAALEEKPGVKSTTPSSYNIGYLPPTADQGSTGNCVAQTLAQIFEVIRYNYLGEHKDFSVGWIYGNRNANEHQGYGMTGYEACEHLCKDGDIYSEIFDSNAEVPDIIKMVNAIKDKYLEFGYKAANYVRTHDFEKVKDFIYKYNIPVMAVVDVNTFTRGSGYHAMAMFAWDNDIVRMHNSWGSTHRIVTMSYKKIEDFWLITPWEIPEFKDLPDTHWAFEEMMEAVNNKVLLGYPDGTIAPDNNITRAEFCAMLYRQEKMKLI